jgi:hypothetical protein
MRVITTVDASLSTPAWAVGIRTTGDALTWRTGP